MQLSHHIYAVRLDYRVTPKSGLTLKRFVYIYWVLEREAVLIDAGVKGTQETILQSLLDLGYTLADLKHIILTHAHADHIGTLQHLQKETDALVWIHPAERVWVEDVEQGLRLRPGRGMEQLVMGSACIDCELVDREWLQWGRALRAQVIHCPGHSPGSVSFLVQPDGLLITGDALAFAWGVPVYDSLEQTLVTLWRLRRLQGVSGVVSSWDEPQAGGRDLQQLLDHCQARLERTHQMVRQCVQELDSTNAEVVTPLVLSRLKIPLMANSPAVEHAIEQHITCLERNSLFSG